MTIPVQGRRIATTGSEIEAVRSSFGRAPHDSTRPPLPFAAEHALRFTGTVLSDCLESKSSGHTTPKYSSRRLRRRFIKSGPVWVIRYRLGARRKTLYVRNPLQSGPKDVCRGYPFVGIPARARLFRRGQRQPAARRPWRRLGREHTTLVRAPFASFGAAAAADGRMKGGDKSSRHAFVVDSGERALAARVAIAKIARLRIRAGGAMSLPLRFIIIRCVSFVASPQRSRARRRVIVKIWIADHLRGRRAMLVPRL